MSPSSAAQRGVGRMGTVVGGCREGVEKPSVDRLQVQVAYHTCLSYEWHVECTRVCAPRSITVSALELTQMCEFSHQLCNKSKQESECKRERRRVGGRANES